ncbi:hypothetical protein NM208_g3932 [Fusarium decemcellulare]|uniref:Uncharacterized protein n=1 Tax=Fusarium decemcellulare TaxID=57161 RepID=A0ACC1SME5_9HYPO|nr:hypothetical protein NM208_g3932 [Fusarium decemcellulare]
MLHTGSLHLPYGSGTVYQTPPYQSQAGAMALHNPRQMRMSVGLNQPQPLANQTSLVWSGGDIPPALPQNSYNSNTVFHHVPDTSLAYEGVFQNTQEWGRPNGEFIDLGQHIFNDLGYQDFPGESRHSGSTPGPGQPGFSDFQYRDQRY